MKVCSSCKKKKELELFVKYRYSIDGRHNQCKQCRKDFYNENKSKVLKDQKKYRDKNKETISKRKKKKAKTKHGKIMQILSNINKRCNNPTDKRFHRYGGRGISSDLTYEDLSILWDRDNAIDMKNPSIDRINVDGNYKFDNCQFLEHAENSNKDSMKEVNQFDLDGNLVKKWNSLSDTEKAGFQRPNIINCCKKRRKTHSGFKWEYA